MLVQSLFGVNVWTKSLKPLIMFREALSKSLNTDRPFEGFIGEYFKPNITVSSFFTNVFLLNFGTFN